MKKKTRNFTIFLMGVAVTLLLQGCGETSYFESQQESEEVAAETTESEEETETEEIVVQVAGAVQNPGVFTLDADARVYEAIACAGGLSEDAFSQDFNQAAKLEDGQMIYVYSKEEHEQMQVAEAVESDGRIDLNSATAAELTTLPGIGESKANLIVQYREEHGGFQSPEDIKQIQGIKDGVYNQIKALVVTK